MIPHLIISFSFYFLSPSPLSRGQRRARRGKDLVHRLGVTLEEMYNGATRKLALQRSLVCDKCEGRGGKKGATSKCEPCRGTGMIARMHQLAPGIMQHIEQVCSQCQGQGEMISEKDRCKACEGRKLIRDRKVLEVHIDKGMRDDQKIVFAGEGDQEPDVPAGDIIVVLDEKKHPVFDRANEDLVMTMQLTLVEALCGFQRVVKTLDARDLVITSIPGEVIKHNEIKCVMGEGMPRYKEPFERGRLLIRFGVTFPEKLDPAMVPKLESCFPARPPVEIPIDSEECTLMTFDPAQDQRQQQYREAYEEDGHSGGGGGGGRPHTVQCPTS